MSQGTHAFHVGETLILNNPAVGVPCNVQYRGRVVGSSRAVVVLNGYQMTVEIEWLHRSTSTSATEGSGCH